MNWQVCVVTDLCNGMYGGRLMQWQVYAVAGLCSGRFMQWQVFIEAGFYSGNLRSDNLKLWQFALRYYVLLSLYSMNLIYLSMSD